MVSVRQVAYTAIVAAQDEDVFLSEALESILCQTLAPSDVIVVVNPGSKVCSPTAETVRSFGGSVQLQESSYPGLISGINSGIRATKTPYIAFLDSDDLWSPSKQEAQLDRLLTNPSADASTSLATNFRDSPNGHREYLLTAPAILFTATTFHTSAFSRFGLLDTRATHHTWLARWWSKAISLGIQLDSTGQPGVLRRIHSENSWVTASERAHRELRAELRTIMAEKRAAQAQPETK